MHLMNAHNNRPSKSKITILIEKSVTDAILMVSKKIKIIMPLRN